MSFKSDYATALRAINVDAMRGRLRNDKYTLLTRNCIGGLLSHDLGQQHRSPTGDVYFVNLCDFVKYVNNIEAYKDCIPVFSHMMRGGESGEASYPAGYLGDILLHFPHDKDFADAIAKWTRRTARINYDEIIVLVSAGKVLSEQDRECFHKIKAITKCLYVPDRRLLQTNEFGIPEYGLLAEGLDVLNTNPKTGLKYYECLDCAQFINDGTIKRYRVKFNHYVLAFIRSLIGFRLQK